MKIAIATIISILISSCGTPETLPDIPSHNAETETTDETIDLVGGQTMSNQMALGVGRFAFDGQRETWCTITRVGKRHFLTAAHCLDPFIAGRKNIDIQSATTERALSSSEKTFQIDLKRSRFALTRKLDHLSQNDTIKVLNNGFEDWAVFTLDHSKLAESSGIYEYLKSNFKIRPMIESMGNPSLSIKISGWGNNILPFSNGVIADCGRATLKSIFRKCSESLFEKSKFDPNKSPGPVKYAELYLWQIGKKAPNGGRGLAVRSLIPIEKDGKVRIPNKGVNWGTVAPGDSGGPVFDQANRLIGVNAAHGMGDAILNYYSIMDTITQIDPKIINSQINKSIIDNVKPTIKFEENFVVFGYNLEKIEAKLKSNNLRLAKVSCTEKEVPKITLDSLIKSGDMKEKSDYVCFKGPKKDRENETIIIEEPGNTSIDYRATVSVKGESLTC